MNFLRRRFLTTACTALVLSKQRRSAMAEQPAAGHDNGVALSKNPIWDLHGHLAGVNGKTPEERADRLIEFADRMGIDRLCIYMGMTFAYDPSPSELRQANDEVHSALQRYPDRLLGFVYLNPKYVPESLAELDRCVRDGPMVGVKLWVAKHCNDADLDPLVRRATAYKAIIFQHTWMKINGNLPGESTPLELAALAARHPEARLICGHSGGDWEQGIRAIRAYPNIFADLAGGDPVAGITEMAIRELGVDRVLFGSDVPGRSFASQLAKVEGASINEEAKSLLLAGNLKRLLEPIMKNKGMTS